MVSARPSPLERGETPGFLNNAHHPALLDKRRSCLSTKVAFCTESLRCAIADTKERSLGFAVMNPAEVARGDQIIDMHVPQRGAVLRLVLAKQAFQLA